MTTPVTFVLLDRFVEPDMRVVAAALRSRHPDMSVEVLDAPGKSGQRPMLICDGRMVVVISMPAPIPRDDAVVNRALMTWPAAHATFDNHRAHLVVAPLGDSESTLSIARTITAVIGGLIATVPACVGVLWNGQVAHPAERWLEMSRAAFAPYPNYPFTAWVGIHPFRYDSGIGAVTSGLSWFIGREIEFEGGAVDLSNVVNKVAGLAVYLIERGTAIGDGDTCGGGETERMKVHHIISRRFSGLPVLFVTAQAA